MHQVDTVKHRPSHPLQDAQLRLLLQQVPKGVADSFSTEQLLALKHAINGRKWGRKGERHSVDLRTSLSVPFTPLRFYLVFLLGKERRSLGQKERIVAAIALLLVLMIAGLVGMTLLLVLLYIVKSWLGINLFDHFSLGIWGK